MHATGWAAALALCGTLAVSVEGRAGAPTPRAAPSPACRQRFAADPQDYESAYCFYQTALRQRLLTDVARVFESLMREHPENYWVALSFGHVYRETDPDRTEALYRRAADGFQR